MEEIELDISDNLRDNGFRLIRHDKTILLEDAEGNQARSYIYKEYNKTAKNFVEEIENTQMVSDAITQQEILACLSRNYDKLYNGHTSASTLAASTPILEPIELTEDITRELTYEEVAVILSTSIKRDENPKLITFSGMILAQTSDDQLNIGFQAESSVGKTYIALDVSTYFPESEVIKIASASPTAFYHSGVWDPERKALVVDLRHKILMFLDMPHFQLLERMRPILSHDDKELKYMITDKSQKYGLKTKEVIIKGPASVFFCSARMNPDDQEKTRLVFLSPSTDEEKLKESLELLTLKKSNPDEYKKRIMGDKKRLWLSKRVLCVRQSGIREVKVPDEGRTVLERFNKDHNHLQPRHQRDYPRIFSFIKAHALLNWFNREKLSEDTIMANEKDIEAGFSLYKGIEQSNEMGLSPYMLKMYDDVFMPILKPNEGVSRDEILKQYYKAKHKPISPEVLRLEILPQLEAVGLIYQEEGERRKMLVYPTVSHTYNKSLVEAAEEPAAAVCVSDRGVKNLEKIFWQTYDALENRETHTVIESSFKASLIATGSFTASEAQQAIREAKDKEELTSPEYDIMCKVSQKEEMREQWQQQ
ncbi:MAG TPA: hypothetical protein VFZ55_06295 [Nitrososphaera sp.]